MFASSPLHIRERPRSSITPNWPGEVDAAIDSRAPAYNLWALYFVEQHRWLLDHPAPASGDPTPEIRERLHRRFSVQLTGYIPAPPATEPRVTTFRPAPKLEPQ